MAVSNRRQFLQASATAAAGAAVWDTMKGAAAPAAAAPGVASPDLLRINHDLHTHTSYSDGASSIPLHILEARAFELEAIAITDHYTPGSKLSESQADFDRYLAEICNTDQGSQFTSGDWLQELTQAGVAISMDGRGRVFDNIFTERLWRSVKYEEVYPKDYENVEDARRNLGEYFDLYNQERPHQALDYRTPAEVHFGARPAQVTM